MEHGYVNVIYAIALLALRVAGQVVDLDDSFAEKRGDQSWIVMFHAPWCGHCRKLQPTFHQVSLELRNTGIKVGKVDATMHSGLASEYGVRGYPTIKFIKNEESFTHKGERSKESIAEFAKMAHGPQIRKLSNQGQFTDSRRRHKDSVFFLYAGPLDDSMDLYTKYQDIARQYPVHAYYYAGEQNILHKDVHLEDESAILVFKDGQYFQFGGETKSDMELWVKSERFLAFPRVAEGGLNEMVDLPKRIVMVVTEDKKKDTADQDRLKSMAHSLATEQRVVYHNDFQFIWMDDSDTANSITMSHVTLPFLLVLEPDTYLYYIPDTPAADMTSEMLVNFLQDIKEGKVEPRGGTGFFQRIKRLAWDIFSTVVSIYQESPWLALLVFGVPGVVISVVCYALCCLEPIDDETAYQEDGDDLTDTEQSMLDGDTDDVNTGDGHIKKD